MKRTSVALILGIALVVGLAAPAWAGDFSLGAYGGYSSYTLKDANDVIDATNESAGFEALDNVKSGWNYGIQGGYALNEEIVVGLAYGRLAGGTEFSDPSGSFEFALPANLYEAFIHYLPANGKRSRFGAGASTGLVSSAASITLDETGGDAMKEKFEGSGFTFAGYFIFDTLLGEKTHLFSHAGFRHADVREVEIDGQVVYVGENTADRFNLDYNGFFVHVGLKLDL